MDLSKKSDIWWDCNTCYLIFQDNSFFEVDSQKLGGSGRIRKFQGRLKSWFISKGITNGKFIGTKVPSEII